MKFYSQTFVNFSLVFLSIFSFAQKIQHLELLKSFKDDLEQKKVTNILFLGDSHIQAGYISDILRKKFQERFGNAGRGLVFPYTVANSNGPEDYTAFSNQTWETFRLVHQQNVFNELGASGFVIGNKTASFLEINFKNKDDFFDEVVIFNDDKMDGQLFEIAKEDISIVNFLTKKTSKSTFIVLPGETFHEIASKYYTTTTKLKQLNGEGILNPIAGKTYKTEATAFNYNELFEKNIKILAQPIFTKDKTVYKYTQPQKNFLLKAFGNPENIFYGFQFLKNVEKGVVFNSVGVNGATYADFLKYPLQLKQLAATHPDLVVVSLGTNEAFSAIKKEDFQQNVTNLIQKLRENNPNLPILLVSPTDNALKQKEVEMVVRWIEEGAEENQVSFFNFYQATGGKGYFKKALLQKEANNDGVHFLKAGYEKQGNIIWNALLEVFN